MKLECARGTSLSLDSPVVMGVLNVTPDSFSDGGLWLDPDDAIGHGVRMLDEGAAIIDVGGESTRPGAEPVDEDEELQRVIPVVEGLAERSDCMISIDTRKPAVARRALDAGAHIVNDTTGELGSDGIGELAAETGAGVIVMHSRGSPATMRELNQYDDLVGDVARFLLERARDLEAAGVRREAIVVDPGFGFAKDPPQNLLLLRELHRVVELGYPVLAGTSRKSFIGAVLGLPEDERVEGTAATVAWALVQGASIVRVHDVAPMVRVLRMTTAIARGEW